MPVCMYTCLCLIMSVGIPQSIHSVLANDKHCVFRGYMVVSQVFVGIYIYIISYCLSVSVTIEHVHHTSIIIYTLAPKHN